jgi:hypothetical protein
VVKDVDKCISVMRKFCHQLVTRQVFRKNCHPFVTQN